MKGYKNLFWAKHFPFYLRRGPHCFRTTGFSARKNADAPEKNDFSARESLNVSEQRDTSTWRSAIVHEQRGAGGADLPRTAEAYFCAHEFQHREDEQKQMVDQRSDTLAELRYDDGAEGAEVDGEGEESRLHY